MMSLKGNYPYSYDLESNLGLIDISLKSDKDAKFDAIIGDMEDLLLGTLII